jgi:two-component system, response regulator YesN
MSSQTALPRTINIRAFEYYSSLARIRHYIDVNYSEDISLNKIAEVAAMEASYFSAFFRRKVGISFRDWLRHVRIQKAVKLLESANYSISAVAFAVGFSDLRTFERAFKRCTGLTARQYKKSVRPC